MVLYFGSKRKKKTILSERMQGQQGGALLAALLAVGCLLIKHGV